MIVLRISKKMIFILVVIGLLLAACSNASAAEKPETVSSSGESAPVAEPSPKPDPTAVPPATPLLFRNGLVVTATEADPIANGAVLIEDGLITAVGEESSFAVPENAVVIDLNGRTIMPGIIEGRAGGLLNLLEVGDDGANKIALSLYLRTPLKEGVTTVRATGWNREKMVYSPDIPGILQSQGNSLPTVINLGTSIAHSESSAVTRYYPNDTVGVVSTEEARQKTDEYIQLGVGQVNILMSSGPALSEDPEERGPVLSQEQVMAIVETAHAQNKRVVAQALFAEEALTVIKGGVDEIDSWPTLGERMPDELLEALVSDSIPVLSGFSVGMPPEGEVRRFLDAGGILVYGTFAPNSGSVPANEFRLMEQNGMTPMEMIKAATANAANAVGLGDIIGTLEPGKQADVIVLDGNLFEDDFASTIEKIVYVVKNGDLVVQEE